MEDRPAVWRWVAGIAGSVVVSAVVSGAAIWRDLELTKVELQRDVGALGRRVGEIEDALRTNRMTRMAPETRAEIDGLRREVDGLWERLRALEDQRKLGGKR